MRIPSVCISDQSCHIAFLAGKAGCTCLCRKCDLHLPTVRELRVKLTAFRQLSSWVGNNCGEKADFTLSLFTLLVALFQEHFEVVIGEHIDNCAQLVIVETLLLRGLGADLFMGGAPGSQFIPFALLTKIKAHFGGFAGGLRAARDA